MPNFPTSGRATPLDTASGALHQSVMLRVALLHLSASNLSPYIKLRHCISITRKAGRVCASSVARSATNAM